MTDPNTELADAAAQSESDAAQAESEAQPATEAQPVNASGEPIPTPEETEENPDAGLPATDETEVPDAGTVDVGVAAQMGVPVPPTAVDDAGTPRVVPGPQDPTWRPAPVEPDPAEVERLKDIDLLGGNV